MSLPKLTAFIAESVPLGQNEFSSLIKNAKKLKEKEEPYIVFLVLDLFEEKIYFKLDKKFTQNSVYDYFYFGNNSAAASQYYLTRETSSLSYLLTSTFSDLFMMLSRYGMERGELGDILKGLQQKNLIFLAERKGEGKLNLQKFSIVLDAGVQKIEIDGKNVVIDGKKNSPETFIRLFINDENKNNKFILIVPKVKLENGKEIILSTHPDYLKLVKKANNLDNTTQDKEGEKKVCYICKNSKADVSSEYSKKFSRTGINKIFTTTTVNTSPYLQNYNYDNVYSICGECYQKLLSGEKVIIKQFKSRIANEDVFILPEGILQDFDYKYLNLLKENVDLAFNSSNAEEWLVSIEIGKEERNIKLYSLNFVFYRTDGNSVTVLETIEDVPTLRFEKVMELLAEHTDQLKPFVKNISLSSIYHFVPVKVNKNGDQLDIGRVLSLYKAILSGEKIHYKVLYDYATEAMDKGLKQLGKSNIDNYYNMGLTRYINGYEDFFIKRIVFGYMVLINLCQDLGILDNTIFTKIRKEENAVDTVNSPSEKVNHAIKRIEDFLDSQGFSKKIRSMFYLGILINRVAMAQVRKEHKKKPILQKIQFQGMNEKEVYSLYMDVVEKLRQYDIMTLFSEAVMNRFHYYYEPVKGTFNNDKENVFYVMAGYSYMVGNKAPDMTEEEEKAMKESIENVD